MKEPMENLRRAIEQSELSVLAEKGGIPWQQLSDAVVAVGLNKEKVIEHLVVEISGRLSSLCARYSHLQMCG